MVSNYIIDLRILLIRKKDLLITMHANMVISFTNQTIFSSVAKNLC